MGSSLGHLVNRLSGVGCLRFRLRHLSLEIECLKASSTIFVVVDDSFSVSGSWSSESSSGSQKTCSLYSGSLSALHSPQLATEDSLSVLEGHCTS